MCVYCERRKDVKIGWEQPCFYDENCMDLIIQFSMLWGMTIGSALNEDEQKQASEMKQYDSLELNRMFTEWSVEFKSQTVFEDSCDFFENKLKNLFEKR